MANNRNESLRDINIKKYIKIITVLYHKEISLTVIQEKKLN